MYNSTFNHFHQNSIGLIVKSRSKGFLIQVHCLNLYTMIMVEEDIFIYFTDKKSHLN